MFGFLFSYNSEQQQSYFVVWCNATTVPLKERIIVVLRQRNHVDRVQTRNQFLLVLNHVLFVFAFGGYSFNLESNLQL